MDWLHCGDGRATKKGSENLEKCQVESEEHRKNRILPPSLETRSQKHHHTQKTVAGNYEP